ncbi:MAG: SDR family oxidoreductase [Candidatus Omnitrophica bacterium]|nr:SDR family oxidoreductase [Candidatus Omnitrophota bacterium]
MAGKKNQTALVTGGAGFLGSHLCEYFLGRGFRVIGVDNFITGREANVRHLLKQKNFVFLRRDVSAPFGVKERVHYVFHFASPASPPDYLKYPIETMKVGAFGTYQALNLARDKRSVFILASTSEVYGDPEVSPQAEDYRGSVNPVGPRSVYDEAKRFAEALTAAYRREHRLDTKIARIFNTYGERMRPEDGRVIPNFISQALQGRPLTVYGDGSQTRSYCYVGDLIEGIARLAHSSLRGPVNLGNPDEMSVLELAKMVLKITGAKSALVRRPLPEDDPRRRCPDIRLAKKSLRWAPKVALREGLSRTIDYFRSQALGKKI